MTNLLIVGGSDAAISAGLRAKQVSPESSVRLLLADDYPNYSICGLPFFLSGETPDWRQLAHRSLSELEAAGLELQTTNRVVDIDLARQAVRTQSGSSFDYDSLIIATGAEPIQPKIAGLELPGVHLLHTMNDSFGVHRRLEAGARSVVIVGGGYIGLEMADALRHRELDVTLVEQLGQVMPSVEQPLSDLIRAELERRGVRVVTSTTVEAFEGTGGRLKVLGRPGFEVEADLVLVVVGVHPQAELAKAAGLQLGVRGAIKVDRAMRSSAEQVWSAGDCVETYHRLLKRQAYIPLGTTAHKQGWVAGENAVGGSAEFAGSLGTQVVKIFDLAVARTGLNEAEAGDAGFNPLTVAVDDWDHKAYYPHAHRLHLRITGDRAMGWLLGAQIVGDHRAQVAKRIDIFAASLYSAGRVADLPAMDLSYTPPFAAPWDVVQVAAQAWQAAADVGRQAIATV